MKLADIQTELERLFAAQDASRGGAIVVWHDPAGEFESMLDELDIAGVELMVERAGCLFALKRELNGCLDGRRILLYRQSGGRPADDMLADVEARSVSFAADYASVQLRALNAPDNASMREALARHESFLSKKSHFNRLVKIGSEAGFDGYGTAERLELGIMAVCMGVSHVDPVEIVSHYLVRVHSGDCAQIVGDLEAAGVRDEFGALVGDSCGYKGDAFEDSHVSGLLVHVLLTACSRSVDGDVLNRFSDRFSTDESCVAFCRACLDFWIQNGFRLELMSMVTAVEREIRLEDALTSVGLDCLVNADVFPCFDAAILRSLFAMVGSSCEAAEEVLAVAAARQGKCWYADLACYYRGVVAAARMQRFYREHSGGFAGMGATALWKAYTSDFYRMDTWYREFLCAFTGSMARGEYELDEDFRGCCMAMGDLYKGWFLKELSRRWTSVAQDNLLSKGYVEGIGRQLDFDLAQIEPHLKDKKRTWVIISDALRYEVAASLGARLERDTKGQCELDSMQSVFPSITKCGMAALLPHGSYAYVGRQNGGFDVCVDGMSVSSTATRQKVLASHYSGAVALTYNEFVNDMDRSRRKDAIGDAGVVYLYHNLIDAIGDKRETERKVVKACEDAVDELAALVKLIVREFSSSQVIVTADHGFLYTAEPLREADHACKADIAGRIVEAGRRWAIADSNASSDVLLPVAVPSEDRSYIGFAPRECIRLKQAGGGENYVHGGIALQEMCVPVLRFVNRRAGSKDYVAARPAALSLVTQIETVSNASFSLTFLQDEPAVGKVLPATYEVFAGDADGEAVTDTAHVVADLTERDAAARCVTVMLTVKPTVRFSSLAEYSIYVRNIETGEQTDVAPLHFHVELD